MKREAGDIGTLVEFFPAQKAAADYGKINRLNAYAKL